MVNIRRLAITAGEPAGIGPDLVLALSQYDWPHQLVVCADKQMLTERAEQLGIEVQLLDYDAALPAQVQQKVSYTLSILQFLNQLQLVNSMKPMAIMYYKR